MLKNILEIVKTHKMIQTGDHILCAVSGGADSVALLRAMLQLRTQLDIDVCACHLNHALRGEESERDEAFVRALSERLHVPLRVKKCDVKKYAEEQNLGIEEAGREIRYTFFNEIAEELGAQKIATAHTLDDNFETMIFHLARGTGTQGLRGIPPVRHNVIRPLRNCTRRDIESYLYTINQPYVIDSSNESLDYTRNRIRREVIPVLRAINPRAAQAAGRTAELLRRDESYLREQAVIACQAVAEEAQDGCLLDCTGLIQMPEALQGRMIRQVLRTVGMPMGQCTAGVIRKIIATLQSANPSAVLHLPGGLIAERRYDKLWIGATAREVSREEIPLQIGVSQELWGTGTKVTVLKPVQKEAFNKTFNTFYVDCDKIDFNTFCVRTRRTGDVIQQQKNGGHRTLKKLMIDRKIPRSMRDRIGVIADRHGVIAVESIGIDVSRKQGEGSVLELRFEGIKK